jgi:hypothetical protein
MTLIISLLAFGISFLLSQDMAQAIEVGSSAMFICAICFGVLLSLVILVVALIFGLAAGDAGNGKLIGFSVIGLVVLLLPLFLISTACYVVSSYFWEKYAQSGLNDQTSLIVASILCVVPFLLSLLTSGSRSAST